MRWTRWELPYVERAKEYERVANRQQRSADEEAALTAFVGYVIAWPMELVRCAIRKAPWMEVTSLFECNALHMAD